MSPGLLLLLGAVPAFAAGWYARDLFDHHLEVPMDRPRSRFKPLDAVFEWFAQGNRLIGLVVITAAIALSAVVFTWAEGRQADTREDRIYACVPEFIADFASTQASRTVASKQANDARRDWDRGYSTAPDARDLSREQLRIRYLQLYAEYERVAAENPTLPQFTAAYCERVTR